MIIRRAFLQLRGVVKSCSFAFSTSILLTVWRTATTLDRGMASTVQVAFGDTLRVWNMLLDDFQLPVELPSSSATHMHG